MIKQNQPNQEAINQRPTNQRPSGQRPQRGGRDSRREEVKSEFAETVVQVNRTSKKTKGGNTMSFSAVVVVGDKKGRVGVGMGKAPEVADAIRKGSAKAKKSMIRVPLYLATIPHPIEVKLGAARVLLKPAPEGSGVIAGGAVRAVVEAAGIRDVISKVLGTNNKASNVYATMEALRQLQARPERPTVEDKKEAKKAAPKAKKEAKTEEAAA